MCSRAAGCLESRLRWAHCSPQKVSVHYTGLYSVMKVVCTIDDVVSALDADLLALWATSGGSKPLLLPSPIMRRLFALSRYTPHPRLGRLASNCLKRVFEDEVRT